MPNYVEGVETKSFKCRNCKKHPLFNSLLEFCGPRYSTCGRKIRKTDFDVEVRAGYVMGPLGGANVIYRLKKREGTWVIVDRIGDGIA